MIDAGSLDRRITFEARSTVQDGTYGNATLTWLPHVTVWAQVQDVLPSRGEAVEDGVSMTRRPCRVRTRYRADINGTMRIDFGGRKLRIISGPVELGRQVGLEFMAEELTTEGDAP